MRRLHPATTATVALLVAAGLTACDQGGNVSDVDVRSTAVPPSATGAPSSRTAADGVPDVVGTAAVGLDTPWGIDFLPDGRGVVTERDTGRVLLVTSPEDPTSEPADPVVAGTIAGVVAEGESGLLGVAVSPDFEDDRLLYFYFTTARDNRVVRATLTGDRLGDPEPVLTGIPAGTRHDGGGLLFDDEGHLFVSTGEIADVGLARDRDSLGGKVLRITTAGRPAPGNPFRRSPVWTLGHRNVEGLAFDDDGNLWASEFGDSTADEINLIEPGADYGWPIVEGTGGPPRFAEPAITRRPDEASWAGIAASGGFLWVAGLRGERLWRIKVADGTASDGRDYLTGEYGRLRAVAVAPDGSLWVGTSNQDGRGEPAEADDRILVVIP
jgi:glucose/arabinose dehydrogenase